MKLPDIQYGTPVRGPGPERMQLAGQVSRAIDTGTEGLAAWAQETIKTRSIRAAADLAEGAAVLESKLTQNRSVSGSQVREELGADFESLPGPVKAALKERAFNTNTGTYEEVDRQDVPMWELAGAIWDVKSKRLLESVGQDLPSGWRTAFIDSAKQDLVARKMKIAQVQSAHFETDQRQRQSTDFERLIRAGEFATARNAVGASDVFTPAEKEQWVGRIEKERQWQPFDDFIRIGVRSTKDVLEAGKLIGQLESGQGVDMLDDKERIGLKRELEHLVKGYEVESKQAADHAFDALDDAAQNTVIDQLIRHPGRALPFALVPDRNSASPKMREHLYNIIAGTQKKAEQAPDYAAYQFISDMARYQPKKFLDHDLLQYVVAGALKPEHFYRFVDLQRSMKADGVGTVKYSSFMGPQEEVDRLLLDQGVQVSGSNISTADQKTAGYMRMVTDQELFQATQRKGAQLEVDERNNIIHNVFAREFAVARQKKGFMGGRKLQGRDVETFDPSATYLRLAARLHTKTDEKNLALLQGEVEAATPFVERAWKANARTPLREEELIGVFEYLRRNRETLTKRAAKIKSERAAGRLMPGHDVAVLAPTEDEIVRLATLLYLQGER
jgi:hypothetical protein